MWISSAVTVVNVGGRETGIELIYGCYEKKKLKVQTVALDCTTYGVPRGSLIAPLKPQSNGPSYSNTVIGTMAVDGSAVTFGTARRGLGEAAAHPVPSSLYQM